MSNKKERQNKVAELKLRELYGAGLLERYGESSVPEAAARLLSTFGGLCRFFTEERYLRGKSLEQAAGYFRSVVDSEEFVIACVEDGFDNFMDCFLDIASDIFDEMKSNNFREPQENGKPGVLPQTEDYYEKDALKSVVEVLSDALSELPRGPSENSEKYIEEVCNAALRKAWQKGNKLRQLADKHRIA